MSRADTPDAVQSDPARPFRVAIVGGGPSGFYAAEALLRAQAPIAVDMFERLPSPFGLVRSGVAPDHPKLKQVTAVFDRIARMPGFRFVGGVEIGTDTSLETLRRTYDALILATGATVERRMGIPGEGLPGCHTAGDFVGWYNGHPDFSDRRFDLSAERAVVVGHGNVALDVARILLKTVDELRHTDIAAHALDALAGSRVREVHIVGRRGPSETRFSPKELHEFRDLPDCTTTVEAGDLASDSFTVPEDAGAELRAAVGLLEGFARAPGPRARRCVFRFHLAPLALEGEGRLGRMTFRRTGPAPEDAPVAVDCGLMLSSIGRRSAPVPGVAYDADRGVHANLGGRVVAGGAVVPGLYVCGWSKRGPQGTIGTNRACSVETVACVIADLARLGAPRNPGGVLAHLAPDGLDLDYAAWERIDAAERARGGEVGKPREKFVTLGQLRAAAGCEVAPC